MRGRIRNLVVTAVVCSVWIASGCTTAPTSMPGAHTAAVFGSFELIKNGAAVDVGDSVFSNHVTMSLLRQGSGDHRVVAVGDGGEFTWYLEPGDYHVSSISFGNRGERVEPAVSLNFSVAADADAVYVGAMKIYVASFSGYHGVDARIGGPEIRNRCQRDCAARLTELQLTQEALSMSILHPPGRIARND